MSTETLTRWVSTHLRIFDARQCVHCGRFDPDSRTADGRAVCSTVTCLMCGARQCHGNGGGSGQCRICYVGILPGWSGWDQQCSYKGCLHEAVARGRGRKPVCRAHAERQGIGKQNPLPFYREVPDPAPVQSHWDWEAQRRQQERSA